MTPESLERWLTAFGNGLKAIDERFLVVVGAGLVDTVMRLTGFLDQEHYTEVTYYTVGAFIMGSLLSKFTKS